MQHIKILNMALRYKERTETLRNAEFVDFPGELLEILEKWKINITMIADEMGMKRPTLGNKIKGNLNSRFTLEEYRNFINVLKKMVEEFQPVLNKYPLLEEQL